MFAILMAHVPDGNPFKGYAWAVDTLRTAGWWIGSHMH